MGRSERMLETIFVTVTEQSNVMPNGHAQENTSPSNNTVGSSSGAQKRTRGKTMYRELPELPPNRKIPVEVNEWGQTVGDNAGLLAGWCGVIVRLYCPLHYADQWRKVRKATKATLTEHITKKFQLPSTIVVWLNKTMSKRFRDVKHDLKSSHFDANELEEFNLINCPPDIHPNDWEYFVTHWISREGKEVEERIISRECQISSHTSESKSYARVEHELNAEAGEKAGRVRVMEKTHKRKDVTFIDPSLPPLLDKVRQTIPELLSEPSYMEELEIMSMAIGAEKNGLIRGMGLGPTPTTVFKYKFAATSQTQEFNSLQGEVVQQRELIREQEEKLSKQDDMIQRQEEKLSKQGELMLRQEEKMSKQEEMMKGLDEKLNYVMRNVIGR